MGGFDSNGDGVVDMHIDATAQALGGLRAHGDTFEAARLNAVKDIDDCSAKLGKGGDLSDTFMASYRPWRAGAAGQPGLDVAIADLKGMIDEAAGNGDLQVAAYRAAEQESAAGFRS
ncbi:hypothetical protein [Actinophytocola sp. NPDC049390]|uniref:hypothetical protein n=1 Tax=Actinophytocola sp. NPDC049390 TaxID=3363894 RepID=UPI00379ED60A